MSEGQKTTGCFATTYIGIAMLKAFFTARRGKKVGNLAADAIGLPRALFHTGMEMGGCECHLIKLACMHDEGLDIDEIAYQSLKYLESGVRKLERQWGYIPKIVDGLASIEKFKFYLFQYYPEKAEVKWDR